MTDPLVCCVLLTKDRPEMAARAVQCLRSQDYQNKCLLIYDGGDTRWYPQALYNEAIKLAPSVLTMGQLRNNANSLAREEFPNVKIFAHLDSDDWSHPNRISEQVALLRSSGAEAVGYSDMLFWRDVECRHCSDGSLNAHEKDPLPCPYCNGEPEYGEAWLYTGGPHFPALGTSLMYWRKTWERVPFPERMNEREQNPRGVGEDKLWLREVKCLAVPSLMQKTEDGIHVSDHNVPRMIASIHGANTSGSYNLEEHVKRGTKDWKRAPEWDAYCRKEMQL